MVAIAFPDLAPSSRSYTPGTYPTTEFESLDGTKTYLRFGNKRVNATLNIAFSGISDAEAFSIIEVYKDQNEGWTDTESKWIEFNQNGQLSKIVAAGVYSPDLYLQYAEGKPLRWRFSSPPSVTSVVPDTNNVSCSFVACLDSP